MSKKYVAFIDILGFKEKILKTNFDNNAEVLAVEQIVCDFISNFEKNFSESWAFSDCIVLSDETEAEGNEILLDSNSAKKKILGLGHSICWSIQEKKYVIRGSLTYGHFKSTRLAISRGQGKQAPVHNPTVDFIFGSALVEAYVLESKFASNPNIIIAKEIIDLLNEDDRATMVFSDNDKHYVDYLWIHFLDNLEIEHELYKDHFDLINQKIDEIQNHQTMTEPAKEKAIDKFNWLKNYHNSFIDRMIDFEVADSKANDDISEEEYREQLLSEQPYFR